MSQLLWYEVRKSFVVYWRPRVSCFIGGRNNVLSGSDLRQISVRMVAAPSGVTHGRHWLYNWEDYQAEPHLDRMIQHQVKNGVFDVLEDET